MIVTLLIASLAVVLRSYAKQGKERGKLARTMRDASLRLVLVYCGDPSTILGLPRPRLEPMMFSRFNQIRIDSRNKHLGSSPRSSESNGGHKEGSAY
jgi:hypothetical protein